MVNICINIIVNRLMHQLMGFTWFVESANSFETMCIHLEDIGVQHGISSIINKH